MNQDTDEQLFVSNEAAIKFNTPHYIKLLEEDKKHLEKHGAGKEFLEVPLLYLQALQSPFYYLARKNLKFMGGSKFFEAATRLMVKVENIKPIYSAQKQHVLVRRDALWVMITAFFLVYMEDTMGEDKGDLKNIASVELVSLHKIVDLMEFFLNTNKDEWVDIIHGAPTSLIVVKLVAFVPKSEDEPMN